MTDDALDTQTRILDAAHRVFVRRGMDGARTQEIADEAGVNKALLHYYFRTKERLAEAVFERAAGQLFPALAGALAADAPIETRVRRVVEFEMRFLEANPFLPGYILAEMRAHPERMKAALGRALPVDTLRQHTLDGLQAALDAEAAAGTIRPIGARDFIANLVSLIVFPFAARPMLEFVLGFEPGDFEAFVERRRERLADFFLHALRP